MSFKEFSLAQDTSSKASSDDKPKAAPTVAEPADKPAKPASEVAPAANS